MKNQDAFSGFHPLVNFLYFALVLVFSMVFLHPCALFISLACAFAWSVHLGGKKSLRFNLLSMLPMLLVMALLNPAFNHEGVTTLCYFPSGKPLTLESILYGAAAAAMLVSVIFWFSCYNRIMTSDKFVYLFGRIIPALSLVLSMVLRFVPKFKAQLRLVSSAQKCIGRDASNGSLLQRIRHGVRIFSILITWALESAIETADSMRSRGYGLPGRSAFSVYRMEARDKTALCAMGGLALYLLSMCAAGGLSYQYFPAIQLAPFDACTISGLLAYALLCAMPLVIDCAEERKLRKGEPA